MQTRNVLPTIFTRQAFVGPPTEERVPCPPNERKPAASFRRSTKKSAMTRLETPLVFLARMNGWSNIQNSGGRSGGSNKATRALSFRTFSSRTSKTTNESNLTNSAGSSKPSSEENARNSNAPNSYKDICSSEAENLDHESPSDDSVDGGAPTDSTLEPALVLPQVTSSRLPEQHKHIVHLFDWFGRSWVHNYHEMTVSSDHEYESWVRSLTKTEQTEVRQLYTSHRDIHYVPSPELTVFDVNAELSGKLRLHAKRGSHIMYRYEIITVLGKGTFGKVFGCYDHKRKRPVAIKVVDSWQREAIAREASALMLICGKRNANRQSASGDDARSDNAVEQANVFVKTYGMVDFRDKSCFIFHLGGPNLFEVLSRVKFRGFPLAFIRRVARQLLHGLVELKSLGIIHCDIKPENIILNDPMSVEVSLVDFGSSFVESSGNRKLMYVQSRMYRSPEILMTLDYDHKIDIWNLAVTLVELLKGVPMFLGRHGRDHMQLIAEILGVPPEDMVRACKESKHSVSDYFFDENDNLRDIYQANENTGASDQVSADGPAKVGLSLQREGWFGSREIEKDAEVAMKAARCLQALKEKPRRVYGSRPLSKVIGDSSEDGKLFTQFISEMLQWDPRARAEPEALLEHPFLQCGMSRSSSHLSLSSCASLNPSNPSRSLFSAGSSKGSRKSRQGEETAAPSLPPASHAGASYGNSTKDRRH